ncbi:hypothetical protein B0H13DRAFT_2305016 [Mycena leptocephala]|nr:hypothetical protein B0H13DRAFT_2305016 [Mycena leptocephala]
MLPTIRPEAITFPSTEASGRKTKDAKHGALQVNLGAPFHILLDTDFDLDTPSPLSLYFDFPKPPSSPLPVRPTDWTDSDSDSELESEYPNSSDDSQYISISSDSSFYVPPTPPTFRTTFDVPVVPFPCPTTSTRRRRAVPRRARARSSQGGEAGSFPDRRECLRGIDEELFWAPMDAFMDVCLARLRPATATSFSSERSDVPEDPSESFARLARFPTYHLASFLDLQRHDSLHPSLRDLFSNAHAQCLRADRRALQPLVK